MQPMCFEAEAQCLSTAGNVVMLFLSVTDENRWMPSTSSPAVPLNWARICSTVATVAYKQYTNIPKLSSNIMR